MHDSDIFLAYFLLHHMLILYLIHLSSWETVNCKPNTVSRNALCSKKLILSGLVFKKRKKKNTWSGYLSWAVSLLHLLALLQSALSLQLWKMWKCEWAAGKHSYIICYYTLSQPLTSSFLYWRDVLAHSPLETVKKENMWVSKPR